MKETYLDVHVSPLTYDEIITQLEERISQNQQSTIIAVNPEKVMIAQEDETVRRLINEATFQIPDGIGIVIASKLKNGAIQSRVTGIDMMERLLQFATGQQLPVFLYGAKREVITAAKENIQYKYPALRIAGYEDGYVQDEEALIQRIHESGAALLFVALGSPRQELFIERNLHRLPNVLVFQGVGGSFDVWSGQVKRAPQLFQTLGMEWLYRLITDPKRLKRQLNIPRFLFNVMKKK